ncbi:MAG: hypothetical protein JNM50_13790 [Chromatiales bacterium]|nr:hypothetical protein [Chromatiales bacterium]
MTIAGAVAAFTAKAAQCDSLIASAHRLDSTGAAIFPPAECELVTVAGFLNLFVAWEEFLETAMSQFMIGVPTLSGAAPVRYALPPDVESAKLMLIGTNRYFDYGNHELVRKMAALYFRNGYPFEPHLSAICTDLADMRTMRHASAHLSSTTQVALESLAQRIFGAPRPGITLYRMLTTLDPRSATGATVFAEAKDKLLASAQLIAQG